MRIAFFGSSNFSCHVLRALIRCSHEVAVAITQPDSPAGRGMQLRPTPVGIMARELGIEILKPEKLRRNTQLLDELQPLNLDAIAVASYGKIIPVSLLGLTAWPLNVHPSPLPLLRGASPLRSALLLGWRSTEVCIMQMTPQIDDGPVLSRVPLSIPLEWNYAQLEEAAGDLGGGELERALDAISVGQARPAEQNHEDATYCQTFTRADTEIDWAWPAERIRYFIRAWDPDLGSLTRLHTAGGSRAMKLWSVEVVEADLAGPPGEVLAVGRKRIIVQAGQGSLAVLELQPENKARMTTAQFLAGNKVSVGDRFGEYA